MFNVAPRYLSGISVFLGDDIAKRETTGELAVFIGPSTKGPSTAVSLSSIDSISRIFGTNNPMVKAAHEFWDGYADGGAETPLQLVAIRVGGVKAKLTTSYGLVAETEDAYDGIENKFYFYINDTSEESFNVKIWDENRSLVYDYVEGIDTGYVEVTIPSVLGSTGKLYGVDIDNDPLKVPVTMAQVFDEDLLAPSNLIFGIDAGGGFGPAAGVSTITISDEQAVAQTGFDAAAELFPLSGRVKISGNIGAIKYYEYVNYSAYDSATKTFTLSTATTVDFSGVADTNMKVEYVGSSLVEGDSQLDLTDRQLYEKFRNTLLEVETWTPDYLIPGGIYFDKKGTFTEVKSATTTPVVAVAATPETGVTDLSLGYVQVEDAATWGDSGYLKIDSGISLPVGDAGAQEEIAQYVRYSGITSVADGESDYDYRLGLSFDTFEVESDYVADSQVLYLQAAEGGSAITNLLPEGFFRIKKADQVSVGYYKINGPITNGIATLKIHVPADLDTNIGTHVTGASEFGAASLPADGDTFEIAWMPFGTNDTYVYGYWTQLSNYETGIGYVKETDEGAEFTFEWSDAKLPDYYMAHFGYMLANFCNDATVGYNTPLTAMNTVPPSTFDRAAIVSWIGEKASMKLEGADEEKVISVNTVGTGLLGDAVMVGSKTYNRSYMSSPEDGEYVDPAYGLLLTSQGFVDGNEVRDTFGKIVDLGKYMCVGAGLLTFNNAGATAPYTTTCGVYSLGQLAGKPKAEGLSFSKVGENSGVSIGVILNRKLSRELAAAGYIVTTREKGLGWVINNGNSVARKDSRYRLISTTRIVKTVIEAKRELLAQFIGKPINTFYYEAAKTKLYDSFKADATNGLINGYKMSLQASKSGQAIGKWYLRAVINTPLELVEVDIDSVIDSTLNNSE